ncbi:MAG: hypothetical protein K8W52_32755 [Deltaproteobacteria bacterium]|nr:hypothetical protein [Deltaproteobacteria bacterium]
MIGHRVIAVAVFTLAACGAPHRATTPSGTPCSDLPVYPAGADPGLAFRRLGPVHSHLLDSTEAERLASLRDAACAAGADAVVEVANEDQPQGDSTATVASGTAVVWTGPVPTADAPQ